VSRITPIRQTYIWSLNAIIGLGSNDPSLCLTAACYFHVSGVSWLIITGSGLENWIYRRLLCIIDPNHNQLQEITISLQPNPSSLIAEDSLHSRSGSKDDSPKSKSKLLYNWRFTSNQFVLAWSPLRPTTRLFSMNSCGNSPDVTFSMSYANLISSQHGSRTQNIALLMLHSCLLGFSRDRYPASQLARCLLPSKCLGATYTENTACVFLAACLFERVYLAKRFSGSID
jgi:hypothetical protein